MMVDHAELIARLEKAEGPDREIDDALAKLIGLTIIPFSALSSDYVERVGDILIIAARAPAPPSSAAYYLPRYTAEVDAAVALLERMLPGYDFVLARTSGTWEAETGPPDSFMVAGQARAPTPALAICLVLLKAIKLHEKEMA